MAVKGQPHHWRSVFWPAVADPKRLRNSRWPVIATVALILALVSASVAAAPIADLLHATANNTTNIATIITIVAGIINFIASIVTIISVVAVARSTKRQLTPSDPQPTPQTPSKLGDPIDGDGSNPVIDDPQKRGRHRA